MKGIIINGEKLIQRHTLPDEGITGLSIGDVTGQNQRFILRAHPGEYKDSPKTGIGIDSFLNDENPQALLREIRTQLAAEGMYVDSLKITDNGSLEIRAEYRRNDP